MKIFKITLLSFLLLTTASCVYFPQDVILNPKIESSVPEANNKSKVDITVTDKRSDKTIIGRRGNGVASVAPINNNQNLEELIKNKVSESLKSKGFIPYSKGDKTLEIALLNLQYQSLFGFFTIGSKIDVAIDVNVINSNKSSIYKNIYRSNIEKRHFMFAPLAETNEENINISFQNAINSMLSDEKLIKSLR